jgi:hypothetical protein
VETVCVAVPSGIEPVSGHVFTVAGGGKEAVDDAVVCVGGTVCEKRVDFSWGWGQSGEVEGDASDELLFGGFGIWGQAVSGEFALDENIDGSDSGRKRGERGF